MRKIAFALLSITLFSVSCTEKEGNSPTDSPNSNGGYAYPERHISRMTCPDGSSTDFFWEDNLLKSIQSVQKTYLNTNNSLHFKDTYICYITYSQERVAKVSGERERVAYEDNPQDSSVYHHSFVYDYIYDGNGMLIRQNVTIDTETTTTQYTYSNGKLAQVSTNNGLDVIKLNWVGNNISQASRGSNGTITYSSYDNHPNPFHFPLGYEFLELSGLYYYFWPYNANNPTKMDGIQFQYNYDAGGYYPVRMYVEQNGTETTVCEFEYEN